MVKPPIYTQIYKNIKPGTVSQESDILILIRKQSMKLKKLQKGHESWSHHRDSWGLMLSDHPMKTSPTVCDMKGKEVLMRRQTRHAKTIIPQWQYCRCGKIDGLAYPRLIFTFFTKKPHTHIWQPAQHTLTWFCKCCAAEFRIKTFVSQGNFRPYVKLDIFSPSV